MATAAHVIHYDRTFVFRVSLAELWATVAQLDGFPRWWGWLDEFSVDGNGLRSRNRVARDQVTPPLPYRMRLDVVMVAECVAEDQISALVHGDLEGTARLVFRGSDAESSAHASWTIEMMQRPMRLAARYAHPLLRWGHDRVVDATVDGFRRHLNEVG